MIVDKADNKDIKVLNSRLIPNGWKVIDLSQFCTLQRGFDITEATSEGGLIPVYSSSGLSYYHNKAMVSAPGVVTGRKGILGKVFIIEEPFWPHDTTLWVKDFKGNHPAFVALVLQNFHLERLDAATSVPTLNRNNLKGHLISVPSSNIEQKAIVDTINIVASHNVFLEKLIAKKKNIKQGTMQGLLTGKKRLPGFRGKWETKKLGELAEIKKGQLITDSTRIDGIIPVIAGGKTPAYYHNKANRYGKTITISGSGASAGYIAFHISPIFASDCSTIEESRNYSIGFIYFFLQSYQEKIYKMQTGGAQPHIHPNDLNPIIMKVPNLEEQTAIATVLSDMDAEIEKLEQKKDKYVMLKQGMMQKLLTGKIRLINNN